MKKYHPSVKEAGKCQGVTKWQKSKYIILLLSYASIEEFHTMDSALGAKSRKMLRMQGNT